MVGKRKTLVDAVRELCHIKITKKY